jgi:hypothetical protein
LPTLSVKHPAILSSLLFHFSTYPYADIIHDCPKKKCISALLTAATATTASGLTSTAVSETPKPKKLDLDNLAVIKVVAAALNEYIAIKDF